MLGFRINRQKRTPKAIGKEQNPSMAEVRCPSGCPHSSKTGGSSPTCPVSCPLYPRPGSRV